MHNKPQSVDSQRENFVQGEANAWEIQHLPSMLDMQCDPVLTPRLVGCVLPVVWVEFGVGSLSPKGFSLGSLFFLCPTPKFQFNLILPFETV